MYTERCEQGSEKPRLLDHIVMHIIMNEDVKSILNQVKDTCDFSYVDFTDINATNSFGDNALHCVAV